MNTAAFLSLFRKDLRLFFHDRRAVLMSFAAPILIGSFFGFLFSGSAQGDAAKVPVALVDLDHSEVSKKLGAALAGEKGLQIDPLSLEIARERVRKGKATVAIVLPAGFSNGAARAFFNAGQKPAVQFLYDPSHTAELGMVKGLLTQYAMQVVSQEAFAGVAGRSAVKETLHKLQVDPSLTGADRGPLQELLKSVDRYNEQAAAREQATGKQTQLGGMSMPYAMVEEAITSGSNIQYNGYAHSFAGMGVQFILFMGIEAGISILLLRQGGLWKRLRSAPLSRATLLGARAASAAVLSLIILAVIFLFARIVFKVHIQGSLLGFLAVCVAFSLMTATYGLLIAALGRTPEAARGLAILATLLMVMLGGAWIPAFVFPAWLQKATLLVPTRWAVDGMDAMTWRGLGVSEAVMPTLILLGFTALFGGLALWKFRWEED
jgi:ABC-2 type transport system permease protein